MLNRRPSARSVKSRAVMWLAQRDHSRAELHAKLLRWVLAQTECNPDARVKVDDIEPALDALQASGQLSDARFIESRIHARASKFGNRRIETELRHLGVDLETQVVAHLTETEANRARSVRARRFGDIPTVAQERGRQTRFLLGRGFSNAAIKAAFQPADDADTEQA